MNRKIFCLLLPALFLAFFLAGRENLYVFSVANLLGVSAFLWLAFQKRREAIRGNLLEGILLAYIVWLAMSLCWTHFSSGSSICFWILASLPLSFCLTCGLLKNEKDWYSLYAVFTLLFVSIALWALMQYWVLNVLPQASLHNKNLLASLLAAMVCPLCAYYFKARTASPKIGKIILCTVCVLAFTLGTIYARMNTLVFGGLLLLVSLVLWRTRWVQFKAIVTVLLVLLVSYGVARSLVVWEPTLRAYRAVSLLVSEPSELPVYLTSPLQESGSERWLLWTGTWQLIKQHPLLGAGLGSFPYEYAALRPAESISFGFFVHNDFLQIWDEGGLPAALLLFGLPCFAFYAFFKLARSRAEPFIKIESLFLATGILVIYLDSLVCFDLYSQMSLIVIGMLLARLQILYTSVHPKIFAITYFQNIRTSVAVILFGGLWLISSFYFMSVGLSERITQSGYQALAQGDGIAALQAAETLKSLRPRSEAGYLLAAQIGITNLPVASAQSVTRLLDQAEATYRWDPTIPLLRAELLMSTGGSQGAIEAQIAESLRRDPRFDRARLVYADYLYSIGEAHRAHLVLQAGLNYYAKAHNNSHDVERGERYSKTTEQTLSTFS